MRRIKIAAIAIGVLVIAVAIFAAYGIPARGLIESYTRDALAQNELRLDIAGDARFSIWPIAGLTIEQMRLRDATSADDLVTIERVHAGVSLSDLLTGRVHINDLSLTQPVVHTDPMLSRSRRATERGDRAPASGGSASGGSASGGPALPVVLPVDSALTIDAVSAENGTVRIRDGRETVDLRIDSLRLASLPATGGRSNLHLDVRFGPTTVRLMAGIDRPARLADGQAIPIDVAIEAPTVLKTPAALTATVTKSGPVLRIDGLNGAIDQGRVRGSMSVSFAGAKPFLDAAIESERIDLTSLIDTISKASNSQRAPVAHSNATAPREPKAGTPSSAAVPARGGQGWSDAPLNFFGLRLVEGNVNLSAREVLVQNMRIAPAAIEATLLQDTLTVKLAPSGAYGGQATGELVVDRTQDDPTMALRLAFSEIDALPFLRDAIDFQYVAGRARGAVELKGAGASPLRIVSSLNGRADLLFENGAVRGLNLPTMVRSLLDMILAGWQANASEETRFSTFSATFAIENGIARSTDVKFTGPFMVMTAAGSADLRSQTLDFRADPRLVSSPGTSDAAPWGIGVPVVIQGRWSEPRIYADTPNILANPEGALRALRDALGGGRGSAQTDAPLGKFIEGLSKGFGKATGDPARDGGAIAEEMLKALGGTTRGVITPQPETTAPHPSPPSPQTATPRSTPPPAPDRDLERGAREILRDLLGR
jgi:AsmA protein